MTVRTNWRDDAACRDADADLFFPVGTIGPALPQIDEAKRICRACPAQPAGVARPDEAPHLSTTAGKAASPAAPQAGSITGIK
jgi:hypothetical protein